MSGQDAKQQQQVTAVVNTSNEAADSTALIEVEEKKLLELKKLLQDQEKIVEQLRKDEEKKKLGDGSQQKQQETLEELSPEQEERYKLMRVVAEECQTDNELRRLIKNKKEQIIAYDGFEPSGRMHIAQGVMKAINVNRLTKAGCKFIFLVADWFALMNNKMGGDLEKIKIVGRYMIEVWKSIGMDLDNVEFVWSSEIINQKASDYWLLVLDIARKNTVSRITRCSQIMGRDQKDDLSAAQIFYPCMQCADIFYLKADICQLGLDQKKVNMLAREYCSAIKKKNKPIILSHHMLLGLDGTKMSKSNPDNAIFMEDDEADVKRKIKKAFCKAQVIDPNPPLEYFKYIVFPSQGNVEVNRSEANGGPKVYTNYEELEKDFVDGLLHPGDVKPTLITAINKILQPVRNHFKNDAEAKKLLDRVRKFKVTK